MVGGGLSETIVDIMLLSAREVLLPNLVSNSLMKLIGGNLKGMAAEEWSGSTM